MSTDVIDRIIEDTQADARETANLIREDTIDRLEQQFAESIEPRATPASSKPSKKVDTTKLNKQSAEKTVDPTTVSAEIKQIGDRFQLIATNGKTWSSKRRRDLVRVARENGFPLTDSQLH